MTDNELLKSFSEIVDKKLEPISEHMETLTEMIDKKLEPISERMDGLELQLKLSERNLKNEIKKSESLVLDEVERVHNILEKHINDTRKHSA